MTGRRCICQRGHPGDGSIPETAFLHTFIDCCSHFLLAVYFITLDLGFTSLNLRSSSVKGDHSSTYLMDFLGELERYPGESPELSGSLKELPPLQCPWVVFCGCRKNNWSYSEHIKVLQSYLSPTAPLEVRANNLLNVISMNFKELLSRNSK